MRLSRERLMAEAEATGFRPEVLEKVIHLLNLLTVFQRHPALGGRLAISPDGRIHSGPSSPAVESAECAEPPLASIATTSSAGATAYWSTSSGYFPNARG